MASLRSLAATCRGWRPLAQAEARRRFDTTRVAGVFVDRPLGIVDAHVRFVGNAVEALVIVDGPVPLHPHVRVRLRGELRPACLEWHGCLSNRSDDGWGGSVQRTERSVRLRCVVGADDSTLTALRRWAQRAAPVLAAAWCVLDATRAAMLTCLAAWLVVAGRLMDDPTSPYERVVLRRDPSAAAPRGCEDGD